MTRAELIGGPDDGAVLLVPDPVRVVWTDRGWYRRPWRDYFRRGVRRYRFCGGRPCPARSSPARSR
jgi:hypothetical protein